VPPPVLGFNNNVRHRGRIFHIQTEDSGVRFSRIVTHLFADGGRIIKTIKVDYTEHSEKEDVSRIVRGLMKDQHRAMFTALRGGELDAALERAIGPLSDVPPRVAVLPENRRPPRRESTRPGRARSLSNPALHGVAPSISPPNAEGFDLDVGTLDSLPTGSRQPGSARPTRSKSNRPPRSRPPAPRVQPSMPQRPSASFASAPEATARSIFGDEAISEQTLDEVILSYLAEDLDGSQD
jgi:hypothetical protein